MGLSFTVDMWARALALLAGLIVGVWVLRADLRRRRINANAFVLAFAAATGAIAGAYFASLFGFAWFGVLFGGFFAVTVFARSNALPLLELLDACTPAAAAAYGLIRMGSIFIAADPLGAGRQRLVSSEPLYWWLVAVFLWQMGTRASLGPKPKGEILSGYLLLTGAVRFLEELIQRVPFSLHALSNAQIESLLTFLAGGLLLWFVLARYHNVAREHRILQHVAERGDILQQEYSRATPECPHPERWKMYDAMAAEVEVLDFLKALVTTIKPELVVETGTFLGSSTLRIAEGLKENGFGRVITCEADPKVYEEARKRFLASGLAEWIELRNESSLEMKIQGRIDLLYCDSDLPLREQEVRRFLPQVNPDGLILMHDASSALKTVREGALNLEREGLLSVLFLPTPRGLVVAQRREGRS